MGIYKVFNRERGEGKKEIPNLPRNEEKKKSIPRKKILGILYKKKCKSG